MLRFYNFAINLYMYMCCRGSTTWRGHNDSTVLVVRYGSHRLIRCLEHRNLDPSARCRVISTFDVPYLFCPLVARSVYFLKPFLTGAVALPLRSNLRSRDPERYAGRGLCPQKDSPSRTGQGVGIRRSTVLGPTY